jgi:hypothetical protein
MITTVLAIMGSLLIVSGIALVVYQVVLNRPGGQSELSPGHITARSPYPGIILAVPRSECRPTRAAAALRMRAGCARCIANFPGRPLDSVRRENETFSCCCEF